MDILGSLQYWMAMLFLQFMPLDTLEKGKSFEYEMVGNSAVVLRFSVLSVEKKDDIKVVQIEARYEGGNHSSVHVTTVEGKGKTWHLANVANDGRDLPMTTAKIDVSSVEKGVLLSTDTSYLLKKGEVKSVSYLYPAYLGNLKRGIFSQTAYAADSLKIQVFSNENYPLGGVVFQDETMGQPREFRIKRNATVSIGTLKLNRPLTFKNPSEYRLEDGFLYQSSLYTFMGKFLFLIDKEPENDFFGKVILAEATKHQDLNNVIVKGKAAPEDYGREMSMMQIRSDWVGEETGFQIGHSTKEKLSKVQYLMAPYVVLHECVQLTEEKGQMVISFQNMTDKTIDSLEIIAHYESTMGKPVPKEKSQKFEKVQPGQKVSASFPRGMKSGRTFRFQHFRIEGQGKQIEIAID